MNSAGETVKTLAKAVFAKRIVLSDALLVSCTDLHGGPCGDMAYGDGAWFVDVLGPEHENDRPMAFVWLIAPGVGEHKYLAAEVVIEDVQFLIQMRDSLSHAIDAMRLFKT